MTSSCRSIALALLAVTAVAGRAGAADAPLLVAVEVAPGADADAADVRQIVAAELAARVVGAREPTAATASDVLLVTLDAHEIRMSLRAGTTPVVSRMIAAPADRPGRLRSIAWLAGNLVRDQVGPIVAASEIGSPAPTDPHPATEPPAQPVSTPTSDSAEPAAVLASGPAARVDTTAHRRWAITASGGLAVNPFHAFDGPYFSPGTAYQIDVLHQSSPGSMTMGAALEVEVGGGQPNHYFGAAALVGSRWQRRWVFLEWNLGLGVEVLSASRTTVTVTNNSSQPGTVSETTTSFESVPGLYARVGGVGGLRMTEDLDLVGQIGAHLSSSDHQGSFLSSTVGVRLRLP